MRNAITFVFVLCTAVMGLSSQSVDVVNRADEAPEGPKDIYTEFGVHFRWPDEAAILAKRIDNSLVTSDTMELQHELVSVLRADYRPSGDLRGHVVASTELRDGEDYLLLRYSPMTSVAIEIQDGGALFLTIAQENLPQTPLKAIGDFVTSVAIQFLDYPSSEISVAKQLHVFVSSIDLGKARCGTLTWGNDAIPPRYWYSWIRWWSDGSRTLFEIPHLSNVGEELRTRAGPPPNLGKPRRFHFRSGEASK